jgi:Protein of unknown function (DUF3455)
MKHGNTPAHQTTRRLRLTACAAALAMAFTVALLQAVLAGEIVPPPVPDALKVPAGNQVFLKGHAVGTQNYICLATDSSVAWAFFGPQATLFNDKDRQIITHFLSPNPDERGTARATWQHSRDTSTVWAMAIASSSDPNFVETGAIPWLLLQIVGAEPGPTGGDRLTRTTFIQRLNTDGGVAPSTGCARSTDVGQRALVPYTADYFFYKAADSE